MESTASEYFGRMVAEYDSLIRRSVPLYDTMIERLVTYLPQGRRRVLELGCGTGNLSLRLAERYPDAEVTLVDASPEMLAITLARLAASGESDPGRFRKHEAPFEALGLEPASFDLVTSCISIHHVEDKGVLFAQLHDLLAPGGVLAYADQMAGSNAAHSSINRGRWLDFCHEDGNCNQAEIESLVAHGEAHDFHASIFSQLAAIDALGFEGTDVVWRNWMWGIVVAYR